MYDILYGVVEHIKCLRMPVDKLGWQKDEENDENDKVQSE